MANISRITDRLFTGGDLPLHHGAAAVLVDVQEIVGAGITHVVDNRIEWSDELTYRVAAPQVRYLHNGQDDRGQRMPDSWFHRGVGFAVEAMAAPGTAVLAHCHMGINRGPSMAFAIMLALGYGPVEALTLIRTVRPVAAVAYSEDALDWWHRSEGVSQVQAQRELAAVRRWHRENWVDVPRLVRQVRRAEADLAG